MISRILVIGGIFVIVASFLASVYFANQIMNQMVIAQNQNLPAPNIDLNAAVYAAVCVGIGFILLIIGLVKRINEKNRVKQ